MSALSSQWEGLLVSIDFKLLLSENESVMEQASRILLKT